MAPKVVVNIDVDNKIERLQGDHLKENMPMAESQISAVDPVAHHVHHLTSTPTHDKLKLTWKVFLENYIHVA